MRGTHLSEKTFLIRVCGRFFSGVPHSHLLGRSHSDQIILESALHRLRNEKLNCRFHYSCYCLSSPADSFRLENAALPPGERFVR